MFHAPQTFKTKEQKHHVFTKPFIAETEPLILHMQEIEISYPHIISHPHTTNPCHTSLTLHPSHIAHAPSNLTFSPLLLTHLLHLP